jgi:hypothetical protein
MGKSMKAMGLAVRQQGSWLTDLVHRLLTTATLWFSRKHVYLRRLSTNTIHCFRLSRGAILLSRGLGDYQ